MSDEKLRDEKHLVREFYETFGWRRNSTGTYNDTALFVDVAATLRQYNQRTHERIRRHLRPRGVYFLDAGSGPIPHEADAALSSGYKCRVCVDFSELALREARSQLGSAGRYVCADITRLPFKDGVFDAIFSAHVIYHIPADEQAQAISELQRSLSIGGVGVIIYSSPSSWSTALAEGVVSAKRGLERVPGVLFLWRALRRRRVPSATGTGSSATVPAEVNRPKLPFHAHSYRWLRERSRADCATEVRCYSSIDRQFTRTLVPGNVVGRWLMRATYRLEELCPRLMARIGSYPMLIMTKRSLPSTAL